MSANNYADAGHRPHARHTGEEPRNEIKEAPYHLSVTLDSWGPVDNLFPAIYDALQSNWGDAPSRTVDIYQARQPDPDVEDRTGWRKLSPGQQAYVESCFARKTLQQVLERITFSFLVDGCTRACTHQLVRSRIGSAMMQHGGRDNDWRHRPWVMPETIRRACEAEEAGSAMHGAPDLPSNPRLHHPITDWKPIERYLEMDASTHDYRRQEASLKGAIYQYLKEGRQLYAALVDAGIPWEDARRLLWMGTSTYIHIDYNYIAFRDMQANRLEHIMDWEINCVAQLMQREVRMKCPPLFSKYLGSHSDLAGQAKFAALQSWPPDGKYPNPHEVCKNCGHKRNQHFKHVAQDPDNDVIDCEACMVNNSTCIDYVPADTLPREHRPEQNPFWVLHPDSMAGGPIVWIPTNGTYPHDVINKERK